MMRKVRCLQRTIDQRRPIRMMFFFLVLMMKVKDQAQSNNPKSLCQQQHPFIKVSCNRPTVSITTQPLHSIMAQPLHSIESCTQIETKPPNTRELILIAKRMNLPGLCHPATALHFITKANGSISAALDLYLNLQSKLPLQNMQYLNNNASQYAPGCAPQNNYDAAPKQQQQQNNYDAAQNNSNASSYAREYGRQNNYNAPQPPQPPAWIHNPQYPQGQYSQPQYPVSTNTVSGLKSLIEASHRQYQPKLGPLSVAKKQEICGPYPTARAQEDFGDALFDSIGFDPDKPMLGYL
eukprot:784583_1